MKKPANNSPRHALTADFARSILGYDEETGLLVWLSGRNAGKVAGCKRSDGYIVIGIDNESYLAHRLAWLIVHGNWPAECLDHADKNRSNNKLSNLREATEAENQHNKSAYKTNTSGFKGVTWFAERGKWQVRIQVNGKRRHIGVYSCLTAASLAYQIAANKLHKEFARVA